MLFYIGLVIGAICGLTLGALITQGKISDMETEICVLEKAIREKACKKNNGC